MEYKGYVVELADGSSCHIIKHTGKGSLPKVLSGEWTSTRVARQMIDEYVQSKVPKE